MADLTATIIAIDPGPTESAYVVWNGYSIRGSGKVPNAEMLRICGALNAPEDLDRCVIEMIACYGMAVGAEVFETCVWIGRFMEAFGAHRCDRITRGEVKVHVCNSKKAKDANVRQALIDRFGGPSSIKKGGELYKVAGDVWAALALAVTWWDSRAVIQIASLGAAKEAKTNG